MSDDKPSHPGKTRDISPSEIAELEFEPMDTICDFEDNTIVAIGSSVTTVSPAKREAYLIVLAGNCVGEMVKVGHHLTIGRSQNAGLRIKDSSVSKEHVELVVLEDGEVIARDLGSRNGTFVGNQRIEEVPLQDGDKIYLGSTTILKFSLADTVEETFQQRMYKAALQDPLTGLFNRRHLMEQLQVEISFSRRHRSPVSLIMIDIDRFKKLNDTYGHNTGDEVIRGVGRELQTTIRQEDFVARFGGEEFSVVCRNMAAGPTRQVAERLRNAISRSVFCAEYPTLQVTISAGLACLNDIETPSVSALIEAADQALYRAKENGRNRVCTHDADITHDADNE